MKNKNKSASRISWFFHNSTSSNAAAIILQDEQGQYLAAHNEAMRAKIEFMSQDGSLTSTAPLIPQALQQAQADAAAQGFVCVCREHGTKIAEWMQSSMPSFKQGLGLAALGVVAAGAAGWGAQKLYTMATAKEERNSVDQQYELIKQAFLTKLKEDKMSKVQSMREKLERGDELTPEDVAFLQEEGLTLDTEPDKACPFEVHASKGDKLLEQIRQDRQRADNKRLEDALVAYQTKVLQNNPQGRSWRQQLTQGEQQALLSSSEITQALQLK